MFMSVSDVSGLMGGPWGRSWLWRTARRKRSPRSTGSLGSAEVEESVEHLLFRLLVNVSHGWNHGLCTAISSVHEGYVRLNVASCDQESGDMISNGQWDTNIADHSPLSR